MDYIGIIITGYYNPLTRIHLDNYFYREFKKAEAEHYTADEFFDALHTILTSLDNEFERKMRERKRELWQIIDYSKSAGQDIPENAKAIEICNDELNSISKENYFLNLHIFSNNRFSGLMSYADWQSINKNLLKAQLKVYQELARDKDNLSKLLLKQAKATENDELLDSNILSDIKELINNFDVNKGWNYVFRNENDYNNFAKFLTACLTDEKFTVPNIEIILKKRTKSRFAKTLNEIYNKHTTKKLKGNIEYFNLIRCLSEFKKDSDLYKTLTRK